MIIHAAHPAAKFTYCGVPVGNVAVADRRLTRSYRSTFTRWSPDVTCTHAKAGGPPDNWHQLDVRDLDTGQLVQEVVEVNTEEGWLDRYKLGEDGKPVFDPATQSLVIERVHGRFAIEEIK